MIGKILRGLLGISTEKSTKIKRKFKKYVVIYDVKEKDNFPYKRRSLVMRELYLYGYRVQKSVFEIEIDEKELTSLVRKINDLIILEDKVYFYPLDLKKDEIERYGSSNISSEDLFIY